MSRVLTQNVHLYGEDGEYVAYNVGETIPEALYPQVTNPAVYVEDGESEDENPVDYSALPNADLQELLTKRELPKSGNKDELIARLEADDRENAKTE